MVGTKDSEQLLSHIAAAHPLCVPFPPSFSKIITQMEIRDTAIKIQKIKQNGKRTEYIKYTCLF